MSAALGKMAGALHMISLKLKNNSSFQDWYQISGLNGTTEWALSKKGNLN